ncbi:hypothetical protein G6F66_015322 [Rhizopus arrhizus]|nr:hypothetical protein G6F66_015322 [Rhizopus arrhizus]
MSVAVRGRSARGWGLAAMLLLAVAACRESGNAPAKPAAEPVAAVQAMALRLAEDDLVAVLADTHRLSRRAAVTWQDLKHEPLAVLSRGSTYEMIVSTLRQQAWGAPGCGWD